MIETANIFTMNCPESMMKELGYPALLESNTQTLSTVFGASETLYACNTCQFADYSRYNMTLFTEEEKRAHRDAHFAADLAPLLGHPLRGQPSAGGYSARALGKCLVERALGH